MADSDTIDGFIIAQIGPAPPVYDPGGLTTGVDDSMVRTPDLWCTVGRSLLDHVRDLARDRGVVKVIVVCGPRVEPKHQMLQGAGLSVASEWFVGPIEPGGGGADAGTSGAPGRECTLPWTPLAEASPRTRRVEGLPFGPL